MRVHRHLPALEDADRVAAWVYRIARNVVRDHHRKGANPVVALADADPADEGEAGLSQLRCRAAG